MTGKLFTADDIPEQEIEQLFKAMNKRENKKKLDKFSEVVLAVSVCVINDRKEYKRCGSAVCVKVDGKKFVITASHVHKQLQNHLSDGNLYYECPKTKRYEILPIKGTLHCAQPGIIPGSEKKDGLDVRDVTVYRVSDKFKYYRYIKRNSQENLVLNTQSYSEYVFIGYPLSKNKTYRPSRRSKRLPPSYRLHGSAPANFDFEKYKLDPSINIVSFISNRILNNDGIEDNLIGTTGLSGGAVLGYRQIPHQPPKIGLKLELELAGIAIEHLDVNDPKKKGCDPSKGCYLVGTRFDFVMDKIIKWLREGDNRNDTR